jgi:hypothetical protein
MMTKPTKRVRCHIRRNTIQPGLQSPQEDRVTLSSDPHFGAKKSLSLYWVAVTESQNPQWRSAEYWPSVKFDRPGRSWISQAGVSALAA